MSAQPALPIDELDEHRHTATAPAATQRTMHGVRSCSMVALMVVCMMVSLRVTPPMWMLAALAGGVLAAAALALGVVPTRLPRLVRRATRSRR